MSRASVYDRMYDMCERIQREWDDDNPRMRKLTEINAIRGAAQDFASIAEDWETWATMKENQMVERGEL